MTTPLTARPPLWRITVSAKRPELDSHAAAVLRDIHDLGLKHVRRVASSRLFLLEADMATAEVERIGHELLADPITETFTCRRGGDDRSLPGAGFDAAIEVHLKGGVMDPVAASTLTAIRDMNLPPLTSRRLAVARGGKGGSGGCITAPSQVTPDELSLSTARLYRLTGVRNLDEASTIAKRLLANDCIEDIYLTADGHHDPRPDHLPVAPSRPFELRHVAIGGMDETALMKLSREGHLFLSLDEMTAIQRHYRELKRDPTDLELETLAQTWSEHCVHKTLKSAVRYTGEPMPAQSPTSGIPPLNKGGQGGVGRAEDTRTQTTKQEQVCNAANKQSQSTTPQTPPNPPLLRGGEGAVATVQYDNLLRDTIARATRELIASGKADWCLSVFEDNAGIIAFDDRYGIAFKAETHNHPSAIEPYGGAATGIGGCIRDIMGCGLGAKPIANTDIFCVASPDFPADALPRGVLHPRRVLKGVVSGVRDYGNRMGIPTVNGAIVFDDRYLGNPLVFCGCIGLIPRDRIQKEPQPGDLVVVMGGRTGRDGIHGATFSSAELTDTHADEFSNAVQIGNAITQKQVLDAQLVARDHAGGCLYTAVTDCGAGGLSSAVGEMASKLGASIDLEKVPLKYSGLRYDEIWISEAQERMVFSVPPSNWPALKAICDGENVEATVIGTFRDDGRLVIRYDAATVGEIHCGFLHNGIPKMRREATWHSSPPYQVADSLWRGGARGGPKGQSAPVATLPPDPPHPPLVKGGRSDFERIQHSTVTRESLLDALRQLNTASKEWVIRQYDHEVQGGSVIKPLVGPGQGPSDAAVIRPVLGSNKGIAIANGICPQLSDMDPYWMAVAAIDEAIRNVVCVGGDPRRTAILDNFCWGNCDNPETMGALVRACQACYDAAMAYGTPFISGKDSLNNEFAIDPADAARLAGRIPLHNNRIRIPGTLLVSAISIIDDVRKCVTMDAKSNAKDSRFYYLGLRAHSWPEATLKDTETLHTLVHTVIQLGAIAAHDCSESGILASLAEMVLAGDCGVDVRIKEPTLPLLCSATCAYIIQASDKNARLLMREIVHHESGIECCEIGRPRKDRILSIVVPGIEAFEVATDDLATAWREPLKW